MRSRRTHTHELLREGEWTNDGRLLAPGAITWEPGELPIVSRDKVLGTMSNFRRKGGRIYGDTRLEIPDDAEFTVDCRLIDSAYVGAGLKIIAAKLMSIHVSRKGAYPWKKDD